MLPRYEISWILRRVTTRFGNKKICGNFARKWLALSKSRYK